MGDKVLIQRKKTTVKSPWDPMLFTVEGVKGSMVKGRQGKEGKEPSEKSNQVGEGKATEAEN